MGRKLILMLLFITCSMHAMAQTDYYYYRGKKIPLILNENKVIVSISKDCKETCERIIANVQVLSRIKDDDLDIFVIPRSDYDKLTTLDSWTDDAKNVILTLCYFSEDNAEVLATPYLNVELKKEEDIDLLRSYAEKYKLRIVGDGPFSPLMPLWFILCLTPESNMNSVECANRLYESGDFGYSVPDLWSATNTSSDQKEEDPTGSGNNDSQEYYPEGTKWTEIRLDTLKYDSWYSKVGDEWVPNFETIEYYVKGEYIDKHRGDGTNKYKCVYTNGPEYTDSLTLMIREEGDAEDIEPNCVMVSVLVQDYVGNTFPLVPALIYDFDWSVGKGLYFEDILMSNTTSVVRSHHYYGIIDEIKEGYFGGVSPLKYVDMDGKAPANEPDSNIKNGNTQGGRIIQGIGITEWNNGECLFGPPNPYLASDRYSQGRNYRSMLVHFERNGEVLYDVWPEKEITNGIKSISKVKPPVATTLYDLSGRRVQGTPKKGVYIQNGKKRVVR